MPGKIFLFFSLGYGHGNFRIREIMPKKKHELNVSNSNSGKPSCKSRKKKSMGLAATWKSEYLNMVDSLNCQSYSTPPGHRRLQTPVHIMERTRDLKFARHWPLTSSFVASSRLELNIRWRDYIWGEFSHSNHWSSWISKKHMSATQAWDRLGVPDGS